MSRKVVQTLLLLTGLLLCTAILSPATATETTYSVVSDQQGLPPALGLGGKLVIRIFGPMPTAPANWSLMVDGTPLDVAPRVDGDQHTLTFVLIRVKESITPHDAGNQDLWSRLLGMPFEEPVVQVPISLELGGKPLKFIGSLNDFPKLCPLAEVKTSTARCQDAAPIKISKCAAFNLSKFEPTSMTIGLVAAFTIVLATCWMAYSQNMMRDAAIPQLRIGDRPYSLGRFQMVFWFCLVLTSFIFIGLVTFDSNSITTQSFTLLGISGATALGAIAVDQTKDARILGIKASVEALGLSTADDVVTLAGLAQLANGSPTAPITTMARQKIPNAAIGSDQNPTASALWNKYWDITKDLRSDGFLKDIVNDVNGPTIHRWQNFIWTLILGVIYIYSVYATLKTPDFDTNLLVLMGISSVTYVGFKTQETQAVDATNPKAGN